MDLTTLLTSFPAKFKVTCKGCGHAFYRVEEPVETGITTLPARVDDELGFEFT